MLRFLVTLALCGCADARQINPGAVVPVVENASLAHSDGLFATSPAGERIELRDRVPSAAGLLIHEYEHLVEHRLLAAGDPYGARIARQAFRDLCSDSWEIGRPDLLVEIP